MSTINENEKINDNLAPYYFHQGTSNRAYEYLGAHFCEVDGVNGVMFRVWAPHAVSVSVVGDFNSWNESADIMNNEEDSEVYCCFVANAKR